MHERRYSNTVERLRTPERLARMEIDRVVDLSLEGLQPKSMLDVGTGSGVFAEAFATKGLTVTGIDPNNDMLAAARQFIPGGTFVEGIIESLPFADGQFDLVFMGVVLHESDDLFLALSESKRCASKRVVILEWPFREEEAGPPLHHRLDPVDVLFAAKKIGFSSYKHLVLHHMNLFIFEV